MLGFTNTIVTVSFFSVIAPLLLLLVKWRTINQRYFFILGLLVSTTFIIDIASITDTLYPHSTIHLGNIQDSIQFLLLLLIYRELYLNDKKKIVLSLALCYLAFEVANSVFFQKVTEPQTWTWTLSGLILVGISVGYYLDMLKKLEVDNILSWPPAWINAAVVFYFSFDIYLFAKAEFIFKETSVNTSLIFLGFHNLGKLIKNCFFTVGICLSRSSCSKPLPTDSTTSSRV